MSFDHLVSPDKQRGRERPSVGGFHVNQEFEFGWLLNRQIGRLGAFKNFSDVAACTPEQSGYRAMPLDSGVLDPTPLLLTPFRDKGHEGAERRRRLTPARII
jgi:hypothetical protein